MSAQNHSRRLVLSCDFVATGLQDIKERQQWQWRYSIAPDPVAATEYVWQVEPEHTFHVFTCTNHPVCYCMVVGPRAATVLEKLSGDLKPISTSELLRAYDHFTAPDERQGLTFALGICADGPIDEAIASRIRTSFADTSAQVRLAAIDAAFVTGWDAFKPDIERLSASDPDNVVRGTAANALREWDQGSGSPEDK